MTGGEYSNSRKVLTLIVPSYNMEEYLEKCCQSVVIDDALMEFFEVIIVNDGSKDCTSEIAHHFAKKYPQTFYVIDKENGHYGSCVNAALKQARGTFVKLLDADDTFDTEAFHNYLEYLMSLDVLPDLVLTDAVRVDASGNTIQEHRCGLPEKRIIAFADLPQSFTSNIWAMWITYRTELIRTLNYRQTEGVSFTDVQWGVLPMALVEKVSYQPIVLYRYLIGRDGQSIDKAFVLLNMFKAMAKMALESLRQLNDIENMYPAVNKKYIEDHVLDMFRTAYAWAILKIHDSDSDNKLMQMDQSLLEMSERFYAMVSSKTRILKNRVAYVEIWRQTGNSNSLALRLIRMLCRFATFARKSSSRII